MSAAQDIADICVNSLKSGGKILFIGNGGSAADSQHLAAELIGKLNFDRPPLAAIALTTDSSILTAIGNDYGFEFVFSRQIAALGKPGDVLIAMSTSGNSKNVLMALTKAWSMEIHTIVKTGATGGEMGSQKHAFLNNYVIKAPTDNTQEIQEYHMKLGHAYCGLIEEKMFNSS